MFHTCFASLITIGQEGVGIFHFWKRHLAGEDGAHVLNVVPSWTDHGKGPCRTSENIQFEKMHKKCAVLVSLCPPIRREQGWWPKRPAWEYIKLQSMFCTFDRNYTWICGNILIKKIIGIGEDGRMFWMWSCLEQTLGRDHAGRLNTSSLKKCTKSVLFWSVWVDQSQLSKGGDGNGPPGTI